MRKTTLLVIEDDPDIVELLRYNLEREGLRVLVATDGEHGLADAARHQPDLVLLDLMLPGLDGLEVCRRLRAQDATRGTRARRPAAQPQDTFRLQVQRHLWDKDAYRKDSPAFVMRTTLAKP